MNLPLIFANLYWEESLFAFIHFFATPSFLSKYYHSPQIEKVKWHNWTQARITFIFSLLFFQMQNRVFYTRNGIGFKIWIWGGKKYEFLIWIFILFRYLLSGNTNKYFILLQNFECTCMIKRTTYFTRTYFGTSRFASIMILLFACSEILYVAEKNSHWSNLNFLKLSSGWLCVKILRS